MQCFSFTDMTGKVFVVFALLAVLLVATAASSPGDAKGGDALQQLLATREKVRALSGKQQPAPRAYPARVERRARLSEDEREIMTKQIMQAISGMLRAEVCSSTIVLFHSCQSEPVY